MTSKDVIEAWAKGDELCSKAVEKFAENFGKETGNLALKTMPYGGIYLIGGVTKGIKEHLLTAPHFMQGYRMKGRCSKLVDDFPLFLVDPDIELGLLGAEEKARRECLVSK